MESKCIVINDVDAHWTLRALQTASWIKNVPTLTVRFPLDDDIFRKIYSLTRFVRGLDSLRELNFYITEFSDRSPETARKPKKMVESKKQCYKRFRALLNAAFSKGMEELRIYEPGPGSLSNFMDMNSLPLSLTRGIVRHWMKKKWFKLLSFVRPAEWYSRRREEYSTICTCPECSLKACAKTQMKGVRFSPLMLSQFLRLYMFCVFYQHGSTIRTLNLDESEVHWNSSYRGVWGGFLDQFQFRLLEQFTFTGAVEVLPGNPPTNINTILSFLSRHPTITHLEVTSNPTLFDQPFTQEAPSLPNLKSLVARGDVAAYILERPSNCERLELVHLWCSPTTVFSNSTGPGLGLAAVASNVKHPIKLELRLDGEHVLWFQEDMELPRRLTQVHDVRVILWDGVCVQHLGRLLLEILPRWLGLLPALKQFRVDANPQAGEVLCPAILRFCPRIELLMINEVVFYPKIE